MCFVRAMDSIELVIFPALELSQKIGVFLHLKILLSTLKEKWITSCRNSTSVIPSKQSIKLSFCGTSRDVISFP